jgi:hypothetical protein
MVLHDGRTRDASRPFRGHHHVCPLRTVIPRDTTASSWTHQPRLLPVAQKAGCGKGDQYQRPRPYQPPPPSRIMTSRMMMSVVLSITEAPGSSPVRKNSPAGAWFLLVRSEFTARRLQAISTRPARHAFKLNLYETAIIARDRLAFERTDRSQRRCIWHHRSCPWRTAQTPASRRPGRPRCQFRSRHGWRPEPEH